MNPQCKIVNYVVPNIGITVSIIDDSVLPGGTKQRPLKEYLTTLYSKTQEFVYVGPATGYAQIALAYVGSYTLKKKVIVFTSSDKPTTFTKRAVKYGADVRFVGQNMQQAKVHAEDYVRNKSLQGINIEFIDLMDKTYENQDSKGKDYEELLYKSLLESLSNVPEPKRCWVPTGSGTLARSIARVWPDTIIMVVRIGRQIYYDDYPKEILCRMRFFDAVKEYGFYEPILNHFPPYKSIRTYDAKVWKFVIEFGMEGDYVWNVGRD